MNVHRTFEYFRCRCALGKHPSTSRTRWLRPWRPMILCWRRHGKAGGCRILKKENLPMTWDQKTFGFNWLVKQPKLYCTLKIAYWMIRYNNLTVRSHQKWWWKTRNTSEVKTLHHKGTTQLSNPLKKTILQQTNHSCNAIHEKYWLSYKERRVDALALRADERRDKLR